MANTGYLRNIHSPLFLKDRTLVSFSMVLFPAEKLHFPGPLGARDGPATHFLSQRIISKSLSVVLKKLLQWGWLSKGLLLSFIFSHSPWNVDVMLEKEQLCCNHEAEKITTDWQWKPLVTATEQVLPPWWSPSELFFHCGPWAPQVRVWELE